MSDQMNEPLKGILDGDLAAELSRPLEYRCFYGPFSSLSHAKDSSRVIKLEQGVPIFVPLRSASSAVMVYTLASAYLIDTIRMIAAKLRPYEDI